MFSMFDGEGDPGVNHPSHDAARQEADGAGAQRHRGPFPGIFRGIAVRRYACGQRLSPPAQLHTAPATISAAAILAVVMRVIVDVGVPRAFRSDKEAEYTNHSFMEYCTNLGIHRELTAPYTRQQNGSVESALWRAYKVGDAARLGVSNIYPDIRLEEAKGSTDPVVATITVFPAGLPPSAPTTKE